MFGNVSVLAVGDLYQLPPIGQPAIFDKITDSYAQLYKSGSLWIDEFEIFGFCLINFFPGSTEWSQAPK